MPQSWPSQWTLLFILFIFSFVLIMIMTFFLTTKSLIKTEICAYSFPQFIWSW